MIYAHHNEHNYKIEVRTSLKTCSDSYQKDDIIDSIKDYFSKYLNIDKENFTLFVTDTSFLYDYKIDSFDKLEKLLGYYARFDLVSYEPIEEENLVTDVIEPVKEDSTRKNNETDLTNDSIEIIEEVENETNSSDNDELDKSIVDEMFSISDVDDKIEQKVDEDKNTIEEEIKINNSDIKKTTKKTEKKKYTNTNYFKSKKNIFK